ncbi:hypothetical protein EI94DRAFT_1801942 [Lactarius quietus]|nr:hypothetical protein EI94DRAFT_1801942 [Lactarius quietus]
MSIYAEKWSGDVSADADYSETDSEKDSNAENLSGSSDEWEGDSESEMGSEENEDADTGSKEGQDSGLTEDQLDMLQKHVSEFRAANLPCQLTIVKDCVTNIQSGWQSEATFNRTKVQMLVRQYLYNKGRRSKKKSTLNLGQKLTYRDIVMDVHHKEIHIMALSMSNSAAGLAEYLGCYQKAVKTIFGGLTEEEITKYKAQAKRWTEDKPPPRQQRRMLEKHSKSTFWQFAQYAYDQFGMRVVIFTAYCDAKGDPAITFFDINDQLGAPSFKSRHEDWTSEPMFQDFSKWAGKCFGQQPNDSDEEVPNRRKDAPPEIKLKTDTQGEVPCNISHGNQENDPDGIQAAQEQGSEHAHNFQGDGEDSNGNDSQGGGNAADNLGPSTKGTYGFLFFDVFLITCLPGSERNNIAAKERSPKSVMRRPWTDKFNFLASLSKDRKYHELLHKINQMLSSDHIIYISPAIHHPAWAHWTWTKAWLSEAFHSGGEKLVWQWLQSCPYACDLLQEGESGDVSVDGIALAIGSLLRDIEAMQFPDEFHPPQHVAHSTVRFAVIGTIIHPALDDFIQIIRDCNQNIAADDGQMLPAAPVETTKMLPTQSTSTTVKN